MYIAYTCEQRDVRRVVRAAIAQAHRRLELSLHLHSWGGESIAGAGELAQFAVAAYYDPGDQSETEAALRIFEAIAELGSAAAESSVGRRVQASPGSRRGRPATKLTRARQPQPRPAANLPPRTSE